MGRQCCCAGVPVLLTMWDTSISVTNGNPGSPSMTARTWCTGSYAISSARSSPQSALEPANPFHEAMQGAMPVGPSQSPATPVGMVASTMGGVGGFLVKSIVLRSKTTTEELPFPENRTMPLGVTSSPSGPDIGLTPLPREAQHCAPGNPPKLPLAPKPEAR